MFSKRLNLYSIYCSTIQCDNLYKAYTDGSDITARENMQIAAFYVGRAFIRGCVRVSGKDEAEKADRFISWIEDLKKKRTFLNSWI